MRKVFPVAFIVSFLFLLILVLAPFKDRESFPVRRQFEITYSADLSGIPKDAKRIRVWIPLASSREGQTIQGRQIKAPFDYKITTDPTYGNEMAYVDVREPIPDPFYFEIDYKAEITKENFIHAHHPDNLQAYLKPARLMVVNEEVKNRTRQATARKQTWTEKARAIYEDVIRHMSYDKTTPGWGRGDTVRACLLGKGNCTDFHSLFISMAHAAEIPARFKIGLTIPETNQGEIPGYHCWAEFYEEGKGWRSVDASEAWKHPERKEVYFGNFDTNKFLISVGRDIDLVPKQSGVPVNIFFYPYVEVDGKEWNGAKTSFQFKNLPTGRQA